MTFYSEQFDEDSLEKAFIDLLKNKNFIYSENSLIERNISNVLIEEDIYKFLQKKYGFDHDEVKNIIDKFTNISNSDLYKSNKEILNIISEGFYFKKKNYEKNIFTQIIDLDNIENNIFRLVNQFEVKGKSLRIPDIVLFINGFPLIVIEFKSAMREEASIFDAYNQLTIRYKRDIPELFKYNAFSVISDGVNTKVGTVFSDYEYFYTWKDKNNKETSNKGFSSLINFTDGLLDKYNLLNVISKFIYFPDVSLENEKYLARYPQYYGALAMLNSVIKNKQPDGDGKGGTYFGATGSGKSLTMLFLTKLLINNKHLKNPSIVLLSDRTDLDDQISKLFLNSKNFIGDNNIVNVESRDELKKSLQNIKSGGVFLTTIQKFSKDTGLLSNRDNIICISDEAHRTQLMTQNKLKVENNKISESYSFASSVRNSFPSATFVGFSGTPIDETIDTFGDIQDSYTLQESVNDGITTSIIYEGRNIKVTTNKNKLTEIEKYYEQCFKDGSNEYQINESKKAMSKLNSILGNPERIELLSEDFINHYEARINEGSYDSEKVMIVCSKREIAFDLYKSISSKRPEYIKKVKTNTDNKHKKNDSISKLNLVVTRDKDDPDELFKIAGSKKHRKELDRLFKDDESNFKIAIVVDMWITGFDVPSLEAIYIDKPLKEHTLIQTISRVNRVNKNKEAGLVVDYIGIKKNMNIALKKFNSSEKENFKNFDEVFEILIKQINMLDKLCGKNKPSSFSKMSPNEKFVFLNNFTEYIQSNLELEKSFMELTSKLKTSFKLCSSSESITDEMKGKIYAYLAARSMVYKLTKGDAPDISLMNEEVAKLVQESLITEEVDEIFKMSKNSKAIDIFDSKNLERIAKIHLPNTRLKTVQRLLEIGIKEFNRINKVKSINFTKKFNKLVDNYNNRDDIDLIKENLLDDLSEEFIKLAYELNKEISDFNSLGVSYEEKSYYDILKNSITKYDFDYVDEKIVEISKKIKIILDKVTENADWKNRQDLKAQIKVDLTLLLDEYNFPPIPQDELFNDVINQASNYLIYS